MRRTAMSGFGNTLFSGSRFIFWSLGPILLLGGLAFLALAAWPPPDAAGTPLPEGIPKGILANDFDHRYEVEGERDGIRFDPRDDVPDAVLERLYEVLDAGA